MDMTDTAEQAITLFDTLDNDHKIAVLAYGITSLPDNERHLLIQAMFDPKIIQVSKEIQDMDK